MSIRHNIAYNIYLHDVILIPGDGVGPELIQATVSCIEATGVHIHWMEREAGAVSLEKEGELLPQHVLDDIQRVGKVLKGPIITPIGKGFRSVNVTLRQALDLYACVRPCRILPGITNPLSQDKNTDIIIRENTEDLYAGIEFESGSAHTKDIIFTLNTTAKKPISGNAGISIKPITREATERIAHFAFQYAQNNGRKKVSCITKSNIMKFSDGLFMQVSEEVASHYPNIQYEHVLVDALCMRLVQDPEHFDILLFSLATLLSARTACSPGNASHPARESGIRFSRGVRNQNRNWQRGRFEGTGSARLCRHR